MIWTMIFEATHLADHIDEFNFWIIKPLNPNWLKANMPLIPPKSTSLFLMDYLNFCSFKDESVIAEGYGVLVNTDEAGTVFVTNFRLLFLSEGSRDVIALGTIPLATIEKFNKIVIRQPSGTRQPEKAPTRRLLQVVGKDMRIIIFGFRPGTKQRRVVFAALIALLQKEAIATKILGPSGNTLKRIEALTGCHLFIKGRDSMKDCNEERLRGRPGREHLSEPLHVLIMAKSPANVIDAQLKQAWEIILDFLMPAAIYKEDAK